MKILLLILPLLLGYFSFKEIYKTPHPRKPINADCKTFNSGVPLDTLNSPLQISKCLPFIPNKGMTHDRSETQSKAKIYNFFNEQLKDYYEAPNEFNVVTNDSGFGQSAQKYDPREDLYIRFNKVQTFDKDANYGVVSGLHEIPKFLQDKKCSPIFNSIAKDESMEFSEILVSKKLNKKNNLSGAYPRSTDFSFFDAFLSFGSDFELFKRYRLFRNNCNKAISILLNFCYINPNFDLQYEDMFILKDQGAAVSNVYCKSSKDKDWTLLSTHTFEMK